MRRAAEARSQARDHLEERAQGRRARQGITSAQLKDMVCAFPTFHADIEFLLE